MRPLAILAIALLLANLHAQGIASPQLVNSASVFINESGTVLALGGTMKDLWLRIPVPVQSDYQNVSADLPYKLDKDGNPYMEISETNPASPFSYSRSVLVHTSARTTGSLPGKVSMSQDEMRFLSPTNRTQSDDPAIAALAANLTSGSEDGFEKVARLAIWVNTNVAYNQDLVGQEKDASWVLQNRQGVCFEYATLFAALARSAGIPARYVTGDVYSQEFGTWLGHAWDEVYLGKWVPADPTWFEVGTLDALHTESAKYFEVGQQDDLVAHVSPPNTEVQWTAYGQRGAIEANIRTLEANSSEPSGDFTLRAAEGRLAPGQSTIVFLEMNGTDYRVVPVMLATCSGMGALQVDGGTQYLILRPGRSADAVWEIRAPKDLGGNYYYTCPLTLNSPYLEPRSVSVAVDPRVKALPDYHAQLQEQSPAAGGQDAVLLNLPAGREGKEYYAVTEWGASEVNATAQSAILPFGVRGEGSRSVYVAGEGGGYLKLDYEAHLPENSTAAISSIRIPMVLVEGKHAVAEVNVTALNYPAIADVTLDEGNQTMEQSGTISGPDSFDFDFVPAQIGALAITARASSPGGANSYASAFSSVIPQPSVELGRVATAGKGNTYETTLNVKASGSPSDVWITVEGQQMEANGGGATFRLPEGNYNAQISWTDAAGNQYEKNVPLEVSPPSILDSVASASGLQSSGGACPAALAILLVFPPVLLLRNHGRGI